MTKEARKRRILAFLDKTDLALPPTPIYENMRMEGITFSKKTLRRLLKELDEDGYVERIDVGSGYYQVTPEGRYYLETHE